MTLPHSAASKGQGASAHLSCQVISSHGGAHNRHVAQGQCQAGNNAGFEEAEGVAQVTAGAAVLLPALKVEDLQQRQLGWEYCCQTDAGGVEVSHHIHTRAPQ